MVAAGYVRTLCVVRVGLLGPHSRTAAFNNQDYLHRLCGAVLRARAAPSLRGATSVAMLPVDSAASARPAPPRPASLKCSPRIQCHSFFSAL